MRKRQNGIKVKYVVSALLVLLISLITIILNGGVSGAYAAVDNYTSVMQDLQKDENFKAEDYPDNFNDYSLQVIQIAESTDKELFLYVYNPCGVTRPLIATCVNMSLTQSVDDTRLYNLTYLSSDGVFGKYLVNDVTVSEKTERYYLISSIYRKWYMDIDETAPDDNTISEVSFPVGRYYSVTTNKDGSCKYDWEKEEVVTITDKYVGQISYSDGHKWLQDKNTRSHYVAFSTDWQIDQLYSATVSYVGSHRFTLISGDETSVMSIDVSDTKVVDYREFGENSADWFCGKKHIWRRIEKAEDFANDPENALNDDVKKQVGNKQWVLRFLETSYESGGAPPYIYSNTQTDIDDVTILRLKFMSKGITYNLGVSDNKQSGTNHPDNNNTDEWDFFGWLARQLGIPDWAVKLIFAAIILIPLLGIGLPLLASVFPIVGTILKAILKGIWWIISAPFRFIAWIIKKIKGSD